VENCLAFGLIRAKPWLGFRGVAPEDKASSRYAKPQM
jgi:hypothetical protein